VRQQELLGGLALNSLLDLQYSNTLQKMLAPTLGAIIGAAASKQYGDANVNGIV